MGHEATVTKKRVLGKVEDCIAATNEVIGVVEELQTSHNALAAQVATDVKALQQRASAASAWCEQNEKRVEAVRHAVDTVLGRHEDDLSNIEQRLEAFLAMGFWARVVWVLFGADEDLYTSRVSKAGDARI